MNKKEKAVIIIVFAIMITGLSVIVGSSFVYIKEELNKISVIERY